MHIYIACCNCLEWSGGYKVHGWFPLMCIHSDACRDTSEKKILFYPRQRHVSRFLCFIKNIVI